MWSKDHPGATELYIKITNVIKNCVKCGYIKVKLPLRFSSWNWCGKGYLLWWCFLLIMKLQHIRSYKVTSLTITPLWLLTFIQLHNQNTGMIVCLFKKKQLVWEGYVLWLFYVWHITIGALALFVVDIKVIVSCMV